MPRALEAGLRFPVVLSGDKDKTPTPTFFVRSLSFRDFRRFKQLLGSIEGAENKADVLENGFAILSDCVVGWENMGGREFSISELENVLDIPEVMELVGLVMASGKVSQADLKKSESLPQSEAG